VIVAVAAALATSDDQSSGRDPVTTTTTTRAPSDPQVELLAAGAEPRRAVRLALESGSSATVRHTTDVAVVARTGERTQRFDPPAATHVVAYVVRRVEDSVALVDAVIEAVEAPDAELRTALEPMVGTRTSFEVDARGRSSAVSFEIPPSASDTLRSQLHQLEDQAAQFGTLLPEEPIGPGARWRVTTDGAVTTFTATELTGDLLRYRSEITIGGEGELTGTGVGTMPLATIGPNWTTELSGSTAPGQDVTIRSSAVASGPL
jgi:hypothetical protein